MRLLIAEDDPALGRFLARGLEADGHESILATDGQMAIDAARQCPPALAILDLNLPRCDGTEVLQFLRSLAEDLPILILTAREGSEIRLRCLEMGADDFLQKPFSFAELRVRCRALLRRRPPGLTLRIGDVEINRLEHTVSRKGRTIDLTNKEFALLEYLMLHSGEPVPRTTLLEKVWNMSPDAGTNVVDVYVNYLRRKLHDPALDRSGTELPPHPPAGPPVIRTVRGVGYTMGVQF